MLYLDFSNFLALEEVENRPPPYSQLSSEMAKTQANFLLPKKVEKMTFLGRKYFY